MLIVFQILAVLTIVGAAAFMLRDGGARHQAVRRILMMVFIVAAASSVFLPQVWTKLANVVGVARGADLLLYLVVLTFLGFVASTYRKFRSLESQVTELARQMAIEHAERPRNSLASAQPDIPDAEDAAAEDAATESSAAAGIAAEGSAAEAHATGTAEAPPSDQ